MGYLWNSFSALSFTLSFFYSLVWLTYVLVLASRPDVTSAVSPIPTIAKWEWRINRQYRRIALGRQVKALIRKSPSGETSQLSRHTNGFAFQCPGLHFPFKVMVSAAPRSSTRTIGVLAAHHLFRPTVLMSSAWRADHRHPPPSTTSSGPPCRYRRYSKGSKHTGVIHQYIRRLWGSFLYCCDSADERTRGGICGNNRKRVALLKYHGFPEPLSHYVATPRSPLDLSHEHFDSRHREPETSSPGDFTAWHTFVRTST